MRARLETCGPRGGVRERARRRSVLAWAACAILAGAAVQATPLYWDSDGSTLGGSSGTTADGTWGTDSFWNTLSTGGAGTFTATTTGSDDLYFSAGTDVTGASAITVNGTQVANTLTVEEGSPTFSGGTITLSTGFTKTAAGVDKTVTINSGGNLGNVTLSSGTLSLPNAMNTGTFTLSNPGTSPTYPTVVLSVGHNNSLGGLAGNTVKLNGYTPLNRAYPAVLAPSVSGLVLPNNMEWKDAVRVGAANMAFKVTGAVTLMNNVSLVVPTAGTHSTEIAGDIGQDDAGRKLELYSNVAGYTVRLAGNNTFSGGIDINTGVTYGLEVGRDTAFGAGLVKINGSLNGLTIKAVDAGYGAARTYANDLQFAMSGNLAISFDGSHTFSTGQATLNTALGTIALSGANSVLSLTKGLAELSGPRTLTLAATSTAGSKLIIGTLPGLGETGYTTLATVVSPNTVVAAGNNALGTSLATTTFNSGATLGFQGNVNYASAKAITIGGTGGGSRGAIRNFSGHNTFAGPITMSAATSTTNDAGSLTVTGIITDGASTFGLTHNGGGTLALGNANTYDGVTTVRGGVLRLNHATALPGGIGALNGTSALTLLANGVLGLGAGDFFRGLGTGIAQVQWTGSGGFAAYGAERAVNLGGASAAVAWGKGNFVPSGSVLILAAADATHRVDFQNPINLTNAVRTVQVDDGAAAIDARISGQITSTIPANGGLIKTGNGTLQLTANNLYTGLSSVNAGTMLVNGAQGGAFAVLAGAALGGSGSVGGVSGAGTVGPSRGPGVLTVNSMDPSGGLDFAFEFTAAGSPDYGNSGASVNDVLRIMHPTTPFTAALTAANVVNVYFNVAGLTGGENFRGGWYTDNAAADFLSDIRGATFNYYIKGDGLSGGNTFNGVDYYPLATYNPLLRVTVSRINETGTQFTGVDGFVTQFGISVSRAGGLVITAH